ncbi:MAG TPA: radical SAM family heme chaperone HemW [Candidatus Binatia bacterium]|jgi:oxygen-independent coproporphyrinogen-3 oxidase
MTSRKTPFSLYLHIPYCAAKCPYCDFNVHVAAKIPEREYCAALLKELEFYAQTDAWRGRELGSIFFGGGTPSMFSPQTIGAVIEGAASFFPFVAEIEITLEANPEDRRKFSGYRSSGINRLSLGVQSFQPHLLEFLGRLHSVDETRAALRTVDRVGFENFSMDLIYAVPGQSLADLEADLTEALDFSPPHLSAYNLTIEEGTPFHHRFKAGKIRPLPEDEEIAMAELIEETLSRAGLERYEISSYAKPEYRSRHNTTYWQDGDYLGIGAGAHSFLRCEENGVSSRRWRAEKNPTRYMETIRREGTAVAESESLNRTKAAAEFMFMGLRMTEGVSIEDFFHRFGRKPAEIYAEIGRLTEEGLMAQENGRLRLTRRGLMIADEIFTSFV